MDVVAPAAADDDADAAAMNVNAPGLILFLSALSLSWFLLRRRADGRSAEHAGGCGEWRDPRG